MPSQLFENQAISFVCAKPFKWRGTDYHQGDEFPQEEANNVETMVRSRFLIPVVDDLSDKPRHWHREVQLRSDVMAKLNQEVTQIVLPSTDVATADFARPEESPEPTQTDETDPGAGEAPEVQAAAEAVHTEQYDPSYHTVLEVNAYLESHPDERAEVLEREQAGKNRKGIVEV
jgi:hypothetical protein